MNGRIARLDHVQLAMPAGREDDADAFYRDLLGFDVLPKPPLLAARGGRWYATGDVQVHLGVDADFRPAKKAHPALVVDAIDELATRSRAVGCHAALGGRSARHAALLRRRPLREPHRTDRRLTLAARYPRWSVSSTPPARNVPVVAAFDFDGTLSTRDNFVPFLCRIVGTPTATQILATSGVRIAGRGRVEVGRDAVKADVAPAHLHRIRRRAARQARAGPSRSTSCGGTCAPTPSTASTGTGPRGTAW